DRDDVLVTVVPQVEQRPTAADKRRALQQPIYRIAQRQQTAPRFPCFAAHRSFPPVPHRGADRISALGVRKRYAVWRVPWRVGAVSSPSPPTLLGRSPPGKSRAIRNTQYATRTTRHAPHDARVRAASATQVKASTSALVISVTPAVRQRAGSSGPSPGRAPSMAPGRSSRG